MTGYEPVKAVKAVTGGHIGACRGRSGWWMTRNIPQSLDRYLKSCMVKSMVSVCTRDGAQVTVGRDRYQHGTTLIVTDTVSTF